MTTPVEQTGLVAQIREDLQANKGYAKSQLAVALFRIANRARQPLDRRPRLVAIPIGILYRLVVDWFLGIELPWRTQVGRRLTIFHGVGLVVNDGSVLGDDVRLRHGVTVGNNGKDDRCPVIGDGVDIGAGAVIVGPIEVGSGARVGANAVVLKDVPAGVTVAGIPAEVVGAARPV